MSEELKNIIINFVGSGGNLSEEWGFDLLRGGDIKGVSLGP